MAIDCSNVPNNVDYDCTNPWGQDCTSDKHFDFASLWKYTLQILKACPNDTRLFLPHGGVATPQNASLTQAACADIAGSNWTYYPGADIWTRLTTWKFPLLQLVASFPRPPLSISVEAFVIFHLLGDPIDTIRNLLAKMSKCQTVAREWRAVCERLLEKPRGGDEDRDWKALALITDAYGEWNRGGDAKKMLQHGLWVHNLPIRYIISDLATATALRMLITRSFLLQQSVKPAAHLPQIVLRNFFQSLLPKPSSSEQLELRSLERRPRRENTLPATPSSSMWKPIALPSLPSTSGSSQPSFWARLLVSLRPRLPSRGY